MCKKAKKVCQILRRQREREMAILLLRRPAADIPPFLPFSIPLLLSLVEINGDCTNTITYPPTKRGAAVLT